MVYRIVCAWCQKEMGEKECPGSMVMKDAISHSICECCKGKVIIEIEQLENGGGECAMIL